MQVGLAVGDIKSVQDNAALQRLAMQAEMMLDTEKRLPEFLRRKLAVGTKRLYPNREWGAGVVSWMPHFMVRKRPISPFKETWKFSHLILHL